MTFARFGAYLAVAIGAALIGCGGPVAPPQAPAREPAPAPPTLETPVPAAAPEVAPEPEPEPPSAETQDTPNPSADEVRTACADLCRQATEKCSSRSARRCRANCERYEELVDRCADQALAAIRCQASVPGLVCSNVVGQCAADFQRLSACESGQAPQVAAESSAPVAPPPEGWVLMKDQEGGFQVAMPRSSEPKIESGNRTWRVDDETGVTTVVSVLPPFQGEVNDKALVRKVLVILGQQCQRDMKIHGRYQTNGKEAVRFDSRCTNGNSWHGMLRISERHVVLTAQIVPPGKEPTGDAFYYSFAYL